MLAQKHPELLANAKVSSLRCPEFTLAGLKSATSVCVDFPLTEASRNGPASGSETGERGVRTALETSAAEYVTLKSLTFEHFHLAHLLFEREVQWALS